MSYWRERTKRKVNVDWLLLFVTFSLSIKLKNVAAVAPPEHVLRRDLRLVRRVRQKRAERVELVVRVDLRSRCTCR